MLHSDKHKTVFLHSLQLEKIKIELMTISLDMPNTAWDIVT